MNPMTIRRALIVFSINFVLYLFIQLMIDETGFQTISGKQLITSAFFALMMTAVNLVFMQHQPGVQIFSRLEKEPAARQLIQEEGFQLKRNQDGVQLYLNKKGENAKLINQDGYLIVEVPKRLVPKFEHLVA